MVIDNCSNLVQRLCRWLPVSPKKKKKSQTELQNYIKELQGEKKRCQRNLKRLQEREKERKHKASSEKAETNTFVTNEESLTILRLLNRVLASEKLKPTDFLFVLIKSQLECISKETFSGGYHFDSRIIAWAESIHYFGGKLTYDIIRGKGNEGKGSRGKISLSVDDWCLFLPGSSTLRAHLPVVNPYEGISEERIEVISRLVLEECEIPSVGLIFDEMEIRHGLVYKKSDGRLIGRVAGPWPEYNVENLDEATLQDSLATHVLQIFLVSTDSSVTVPLGYFPTRGVSHVWLTTTLQSLTEVSMTQIKAYLLFSPSSNKVSP